MNTPAVSHAWGVFARSIAPVSIHERRSSAENSADLLREREPQQCFRVLRVTQFTSPTDRDARNVRDVES